MDFNPHPSDDSAHNAATKFEHMKMFINVMYNSNLFIEDVIIYDSIYGCIKQCRCSNAM